MSGQPNPFPRLKVTIKQWMIFLALLAVFNYLAVLLVQKIPTYRMSAEQVRLRTAVAFLVMNGLVIGFGVFSLLLDWWSKVYHHKRALPDPPPRTIVWQVVKVLCFGLWVTLTNIAIQSYRIGRAGPFLAGCLAASAWLLSVKLFAWTAKKTVGKATEDTQAVDDPLDTVNHPT